MRTLIKNATLLDGVCTRPFPGDVYLKGDRIEAVGAGLDFEADAVLDCGGLLVAPGFVDIHRHPDLAVFGEAFGESELAQGITSIVGGNCGLSPVPMNAEWEQASRDFLAPCLGAADTPVFDSFPAYLQGLRGRPLPVNMGMLAAVGAIKTCVKGFGPAPFTGAEMDRARALLGDALDRGALGVSLGVMYPPECYTSMEEYIRLLGAATPYGRPMCCHIRGEGASLVESVQEALDIAREVELPLHISHFKSTGLQSWRKLIYQAMERIERAQGRGMDVTVDFYPYEAGASTMLSLVPPELLGTDLEAFLGEIVTQGGKARMREALYRSQNGWDNMVQAIGWERIVLSSAEGMEECAGLDFCAVAQKLGLSEPSDAMCQVLAGTRGKAGVVLMSMCPEDVRTVAALPYSMLISDALYGGGAAHPRQKGAFPRFLKQFVPQALSLGEAIRKMTALPAQRLGIPDRGRLQEGCYADIAIFDPGRFTDRATYAQPQLLAEGMDTVLVNGKLAWKNQARLQTEAGRILLASQQK